MLSVKWLSNKYRVVLMNLFYIRNFSGSFQFLLYLQNWIHNHKKRNVDTDECTDVGSVMKRQKIRKASLYNLFSNDFSKTGICTCEHVSLTIITSPLLMLDLLLEKAQGKSLGESCSLLAEKWRDLSVEEQRTYEQKMEEVHVNESTWENLSPKDRRVL